MKKSIFVIALFNIIVLINIIPINANQQLKEIYKFQNGETGYGSLINPGNSLLITYFTKNEEKGLYWFENGKISNKILKATNGVYSPNGKYYAYEKEGMIYIIDEKGSFSKKIQIKNLYFPVVWTNDSKKIYFCEQSKEYIIYCFDVEKGVKKKVLKSESIFFHPITIRDENVLYLLENTIPDSDEAVCNIVKYDLRSKKFVRVKLPRIENLNIFQSYTVSPNGKIVLFENTTDGYLYVVDINKSKIIDKIKTPMNSSPEAFNWKPDGSFVIFTMTWKEIYQYEI